MNDLPKFEDFLKQSLLGNKFTMYISDKKGYENFIKRKPTRECKVQIIVEVIQVDVDYNHDMIGDPEGVEIDLILQSDSGKRYGFYDWDLNN